MAYTLTRELFLYMLGYIRVYTSVLIRVRTGTQTAGAAAPECMLFRGEQVNNNNVPSACCFEGNKYYAYIRVYTTSIRIRVMLTRRSGGDDREH